MGQIVIVALASVMGVTEDEVPDLLRGMWQPNLAAEEGYNARKGDDRALNDGRSGNRPGAYRA